MASKDKQARVSFAPGTKNKYVIVVGDHETPYLGDNGRVYDDWETAQHRCEWLNWSSASKQSGKYTHPREEEAAKRAQARAQLIEAHRALQEEERYGKSVATQLAAFRAERQREEQEAEKLERMAGGEGHFSAKERRALQQEAQKARKRAESLSKRIARLEATPPLPSRLATKKEKEDDVRGRQEAAVPAGAPDDEPGGPAQAAS